MSSSTYPLVIPPPTMLPPPAPYQTELSGSSSSSNKRRRKDAGRVYSSYTHSSVSSEFSSSVKKKPPRVIDDASCWHCGAQPTDICHVIGKKDREFTELVERGLITFDHLGHLDNALPLCPTCHRNFDDLNKPGLIFLPSDLQYFIDFEMEDYMRRQASTKATGTVLPRTCPNPQMYYEHQLRTRQTEEEDQAWGGLYWRYTLYDYFPKLGQENGWIPGRGPFQDPESWHGAPMAAIWRAFLILGNPLCGIPDEETRLLRELQDLYKRQIHLSTVSGSSNSGNGDDDEDDDDDHTSVQRTGSATQRLHTSAQRPCATATTAIQQEKVPHIQKGSDQNHSTQYDHNWLSKADSGIDMRSHTSDKCLKSCTTPPRHAPCEPAKPDVLTTHTERFKWNLPNSRKDKQELEMVEPNRTLPRARPRSKPRYQQSWVWGPTSSSGDKVAYARKRQKLNVHKTSPS